MLNAIRPCPENLAMIQFGRPFDTLKELRSWQLSIYERMVQGGHLGAVPAALFYCVECRIAAPEWLLRAALILTCRTLRNEKTKKRGRAAGVVPRLRADMIDYARFDAIREVREKQKELAEEVRELEGRKGVPKEMIDERCKLLAWVGKTWDDAYACAAMLLEGSESFAGVDAMKASYRRVLKNSRSPDRTFRYHLLDPQILEQLGIGDVGFVRRDRKIRGLYDLTL